MKKFLITVTIPFIIVTTMLVNFVGAAVLDLTGDQWPGATVTDGRLVFGGYNYYQYNFEAEDQATEGSYEFDIIMNGSGTWMNFYKGYAHEKDKISITAVGAAYDDEGQPNENVTIDFARASDNVKYSTVFTTLEYNVVHKIAISYSFDGPTKTLTQTMFINGEAVAIDVQGDFSASLWDGFKFENLFMEAATMSMGNIRWSSDPQDFIPFTSVELTDDKWNPAGADEKLTFGGYNWYQYDFPTAASQTTKGSYEFDITMNGSGTWMNFAKGYVNERDKVSLTAVGAAYDDEGQPNDNVTISFGRVSDNYTYATFYTTLEYNVTYKITISYSFDGPTKTLTQSLYIDGKEIAKDVQGNYSASLWDGFTFKYLAMEAATMSMENIVWSADMMEYVPELTGEISADEFTEGLLEDDIIVSLSKTTDVTGVKVNENELGNDDFSYDSNTREITIDVDYLNSLVAGEYTIEVVGGNVSVLSFGITVLEAPTPTPEPIVTTEPTATPEPTVTTEPTQNEDDETTPGDGNQNIYVYLILLALISVMSFKIYSTRKQNI